MAIIKDIQAREILDSRGNLTIEATVFTTNSMGMASVPSGASKGEHEALELRDGDKRFHGLGVQKAINNVNKIIAPLLKGIDCTRQRELDSLMIEKDGYKNKSKLGANAILAVSLACARAAANAQGKMLYQYLNGFPQIKKNLKLPQLFFNVINGGAHADNKLKIQEFMIVPKMNSLKENVRVGSEIYHSLKVELHRKYGSGATNVGDEGGFASAKLKRTREVLDLLVKIIKQAGYQGKVDLALDCAASYFNKRNKYSIDGRKLTKAQLLNFYIQLIKKYPIISIEDPFDEEDFSSFANLQEKTDILIVGDDLTVTNSERIEAAIKEKSCNCLLLKVNQIGTLTEALDAAELAFKAGWKVMVSHRSGETEDTFIADLAVALGCGMIKSGAPCRGERTAKYNQLIRIQEWMKRKV
jgi:enolase